MGPRGSTERSYAVLSEISDSSAIRANISGTLTLAFCMHRLRKELTELMGKHRASSCSCLRSTQPIRRYR